jgi:hypothetical protein
MLATASAITVNPMFLRHDLMIELGRLEMAIEDVRNQDSANDVAPLESRIAHISNALSRLTV